MITFDIQSTFTKVEVAPLYAHLHKQIYFNGYSLIINGQAQGYWAEHPNILSNELCVDQISVNFALRPSWAYHSKYTTIYYCPTEPYNLNNIRIQPFLEVINSFDGHNQNKSYLTYKINNGMLYTGIECINLPILNPLLAKWRSTLWSLKYVNDITILKEVPQKYRHITLSIKQETDILANHLIKNLPAITKWSETSFMEARKFSIKLFKEIMK